MKFVKVSDAEPVVDYLAETIKTQLEAGKKVLWLVCGGSAIQAAAQVSAKLAGLDLSRLTMSLTDERYGEVGHVDSNWRQLDEAAFDLPGATLQPVLTGTSRNETVAQWGAWLQKSLEQADYSIALFGVGSDGHIAGMLPGTAGVHSEDFAVGYDAGNFQRITMTGKAMAALDEAVVFMTGEAKRPVVERLATDVSVDIQPAQLVKTISTVTIFNDHQGDES